MAITGSIAKPGDKIDISYSGGVQTYLVPEDGLYKLEVWGARGGNPYSGAGGYSVGYIWLIKDEALYICVGGVGGDGAYKITGTGGYNGGGRSAYPSDTDGADRHSGGGGGATHISSKVDRGTLDKYANHRSEILIVAGGGGGGCVWITKSRTGNGGSGGGDIGGNGTGYSIITSGGTQNGPGPTGVSMGTFGIGGYGGVGTGDGKAAAGGGGGGFYGGNAGNQANGGGGGSGYIGGVPEIKFNGKIYTPSTQNGIWTGVGKAAITFVEQAGSPCYLGKKPVSIYLGKLDTNYHLDFDNSVKLLP